MFNKLGFTGPTPVSGSSVDKTSKAEGEVASTTEEVNRDASTKDSMPTPVSPETSEAGTPKKSDGPRRKRSRRRRKAKSRTKVEPIAQKEKHIAQQQAKEQKQQKQKVQQQQQQKVQQQQQQTSTPSKKQHDAPMTKRDLYFALKCDMVGIAPSDRDMGSQSSAVGRVTVVNWENQVVLDTFVQVPVPVADFRTSTSGIVPDDVYSSQAMSFAQVRATVERIITGKILVGHNLEANLIALGLSHPWCDVRDTASFAPFMGQFADPVTGQRVLRPRTLRDLVWTILKRELPEPKGRNRPLEDCIACLDLYKAFRREWEQDLVKRAQQKESEQSHQQQRLEKDHGIHHNHHGSPYRQNIPQSRGYMHPQHHPMQHQHQPQRPRIPSYEMLPPNMIQPSPYALGHMQSHQQIPPMPQEMISPPEVQTQHNPNQNSWFRRPRKTKYLQPSLPQQQQQQQHPHPVASTALSAQAMEVLSAQDVPVFRTSDHDRHASSVSYDGSTLYDASTEYESSTLYEDSVASGSISSRQYVHDEAQSSFHEVDVGCGAGSNMQSSEPSSWFRFGSKRASRYQQQQQQQQQSQGRQSLTVLQESAEEQGQHFEGVLDPPMNGVVTVPLNQAIHGHNPTSCDAPKYFTSLDASTANLEKNSSSGSGWFGFRRSKSPKTNHVVEERDNGGSLSSLEDTLKAVSVVPAVDEEETEFCSNEQEAILSEHAPKLKLGVLDENPQETDRDALSVLSHDSQSRKSDSVGDAERQLDQQGAPPSKMTITSGSSKWFGFRRSKSPSSKERRRGQWLSASSAGFDNTLPDQGTMRTDTTASTEEDWLKEVMNEPADIVTEPHIPLPGQDFAEDWKPFAESPEFPAHDVTDVRSLKETFDRHASTFDENTVTTIGTTDLPEPHRHQNGGEKNSSNWFRFLRKGPSSMSRQFSRLEVAGGEDVSPPVTLEEASTKDIIGLNGELEKNSFIAFESFNSSPVTATSSYEEDGNSNEMKADANRSPDTTQKHMVTPGANEGWLEEVMAPSSALSPAWFGSSPEHQSTSHVTTAESSPNSTRATTTLSDGGIAGMEHLDTFLRARLYTESTIPTVASEEYEDDDYLQDYVHGMEKNFSFLNI